MARKVWHVHPKSDTYVKVHRTKGGSGCGAGIASAASIWSSLLTAIIFLILLMMGCI